MRKIITFIIAFSLISLLFTFSALAHKGRTDSYGGHNSPTGYHYHHGYPPHQHTDGICPYDYDDQTNHHSGGSGSSGNRSDYPRYSPRPSDAPTTKTTTKPTTKPSPIPSPTVVVAPEKPYYSLWIILIAFLTFISFCIIYSYIRLRNNSDSRVKHETIDKVVSEPTAQAPLDVGVSHIEAKLHSSRTVGVDSSYVISMVKSILYYKPSFDDCCAVLNIVPYDNKKELCDRFERSKNLKILQNDNCTSCLVQGSSNNEYIVTLTSCTCDDFYHRHIACKHMFRFARYCLDMSILSQPVNIIIPDPSASPEVQSYHRFLVDKYGTDSLLYIGIIPRVTNNGISIVYLNNTSATKKYHLINCRYLKGEIKELPVLFCHSYTPCSVCNPPN